MAEQREPGGPLVELQVLQRFEERIADDLHDRPLEAETAELRRGAAELVSRAGAVSLYDLLGVSVGSGDAEVHAAYMRLARRVHPSLGARIGLQEALLRVLFEQATYAYLVLSDPERRKEYDREQQVKPEVPLASEEEVAATRRGMAQKVFRRAQGMMRNEEYHYVVELLRDTIHWDPRPEAYALLGEAQAKNPRWRDEAVENLQTAIRLAPRESAYRLKLAQIYEEMERVDDAVAEYRDVLQKRPNQPDAQAALERLGALKR